MSIIEQGTVLPKNKIEFLEKIGEGGEAEVWKVRELEGLRRTCAAKVVTFPLADSANDEKRDRAEQLVNRDGKAWRDAQCDNVVPLHLAITDVIEKDSCDHVVVCLMMEWSELGDASKFKGASDITRSSKDLRSFLLGMARGLSHSHSKDVVHCDVKSSNILVFLKDGRPIPKLSDFGAAFCSLRVQDYVHAGTPEYMAPERTIEQPPTKLSDVYSLGVVFYELITGKLPFELPQGKPRIEWYSEAHAKINVDVQPVADVAGEQIAELVDHMLQKNPGERVELQTVIAVLSGLEDESIIKAADERSKELVVTPGRYRWNPALHVKLDHVLYYSLLKGDSPLEDFDRIKRKLIAAGFSGFSIYRVLGSFDYLVRIWVQREKLNAVKECLTEFNRNSARPPESFYVNSHFMLANSRQATDVSGGEKDEILRGVLSCMDAGDAEKERKSLQAKRYLLRSKNVIPEKVKAHPRFFLIFKPLREVDGMLLEGVAGRLRTFLGEELKKPSEPKELSVYTGDGDWSILVKFRLTKFLHYREVFFAMLQTFREEAKVSRFDLTTFVEIDEQCSVEADDGPLCDELTELARKLELNGNPEIVARPPR